jgi:hypothetical protein
LVYSPQPKVEDMFFAFAIAKMSQSQIYYKQLRTLHTILLSNAILSCSRSDLNLPYTLYTANTLDSMRSSPRSSGSDVVADCSYVWVSAERLQHLTFLEANLSSILDSAVESYRRTQEKKKGRRTYRTQLQSRSKSPKVDESCFRNKESIP